MTRKRTSPVRSAQPYRYASPNVPLTAIRRFARRIAELFNPEKIVLFGSYAYGKLAARNNPASAIPAAWALVNRTEQMQSFLATKLRPSPGPRAKDVERWLTDLGSSEFAEREAAPSALAELGRVVEGQLREARRTTTSAEVRRRAGMLLERLDAPPSAVELRMIRMVQACELAATAEARELLRHLASGAPAALLTEDARAALERLDRRPKREK